MTCARDARKRRRSDDMPSRMRMHMRICVTYVHTRAHVNVKVKTEQARTSPAHPERGHRATTSCKAQVLTIPTNGPALPRFTDELLSAVHVRARTPLTHITSMCMLCQRARPAAAPGTAARTRAHEGGAFAHVHAWEFRYVLCVRARACMHAALTFRSFTDHALLQRFLLLNAHVHMVNATAIAYIS